MVDFIRDAETWKIEFYLSSWKLRWKSPNHNVVWGDDRKENEDSCVRLLKYRYMETSTVASIQNRHLWGTH